MATHTPGPWTYDAHDDEADVLSEYGQVARVFGSSEHDGPAKDDEGEANARLIAAAPDYDAAARDFIKDAENALKGGSQATFMDLVTILSQHKRAFRAAIAKAEGK